MKKCVELVLVYNNLRPHEKYSTHKKGVHMVTRCQQLKSLVRENI